ncbi:MAG: hypothetical protein ABI692_13865 [Terracoccus sp.]
MVLTTLLRAASELSLTRIDLPFLLGTNLTSDRKRDKALGYVLLPVVHSTDGSTYTAAGSSPQLEPPAFLMRNDGARTRRSPSRPTSPMAPW